MRLKAFFAIFAVIALLLSFGVAVKDAKADAILFPWIVKGTGVSTLVSVVNTADTSSLHYIYYYKGASASLTATCEEHDFSRTTSQNDIVTFDAALNINGGKAIYSDGAASSDNAYYAGAIFGLQATGDNRAFLVVENQVATDNTLYGEAVILELSAGAAWGYDAYNSSDYAAAGRDFSETKEVLGEVITTTDFKPVVLFPVADFTTKFFVTPVYTNQSNGKLAVKVKLGNSSGTNGIYDKDENFISQSAEPTVVCTGVLAPSDLISSATYNDWVTRGGQAWAYVTTETPTADSPDVLTEVGDAVIGKLEYTTASIDLEGKTVPGAVNNFIWIRK